MSMRSCAVRGSRPPAHGTLLSLQPMPRSSGHFAAATACAPDHLRLISAETLSWYQSSAIARRGFCGTCGSQLFWEPAHGGHISIWAGTLETPTGLKAVEHIFVAEKGDYYDITDRLPQWPQGSQPC